MAENVDEDQQHTVEPVMDHALSIRQRGSLKGHCHAIWQLYNRLESAFASIEFQN